MRKSKLLIVITLILTLLVALESPSYAWYGSYKYATIQDVHLTDTYWWARELGYGDYEAKYIARHNDGVDAGFRFFDKTWHLDRRYVTGDNIDTRQKHADEEMAKAKELISKVPGSSYSRGQSLRKEAWEHLGRGLHAIQDMYGHMDAGVGKPISFWKPSSHGMEGVIVNAIDIDGTVKQLEVEKLYDDVLWDYTPEEGWHKHNTKEENSRWLKTRDASKEYLYSFLVYGYGPGK